jgi:hypothetical protein
MVYRIDILDPGPWPFRKAPGDTLERYNRANGRWEPCTGTPDNYGYPVVSWKPKGGKRMWKRLHILIWTEYNGPVPAGFEIDHMDGNKSNSSLSNLRLVTHKENLAHARDILGSWSKPKLEPWQFELLLALPVGCCCLHALAWRWNVSKFTLANIRSKAKAMGDPRYLGGL